MLSAQEHLRHLWLKPQLHMPDPATNKGVTVHGGLVNCQAPLSAFSELMPARHHLPYVFPSHHYCKPRKRANPFPQATTSRLQDTFAPDLLPFSARNQHHTLNLTYTHLQAAAADARCRPLIGWVVSAKLQAEPLFAMLQLLLLLRLWHSPPLQLL